MFISSMTVLIKMTNVTAHFGGAAKARCVSFGDI